MALGTAWAASGREDWIGPQPLNTYGHTGLIEMPSSRMMSDGELSVGLATAPDTYRSAMSFQIFPWLEGTFRYSRIDKYFPNDPKREQLLDRSFGLKVRLWEETEYLPAVSVGVLDILGTGIYGGEYVVASKAFGDFDFTLGLGWGRLGSVGMFKNPLGVISDRFYDRPVFDPLTDKGGKPLFSSVFRGREVSLFGGVTWKTPIEGLTAIIEYSGDEYLDEGSRNGFKPDSQFNFGLNYRPDPVFEGTVAFLYGNTISFRAAFHLDPTVESMKVLDPPPLPPTVRPPEQRPRTIAEAKPVVPAGPPVDLSELRGIQTASAESDWSLSEYVKTGNALIDQPSAPAGGSLQDIMTTGQWYNVPAIRDQIIASLKKLAREQNIGLEAVDLKPNYVSVFYENTHYTRDTELIHRLLRVLTTLPPSVEHFYVTSIVDGFPSTEVMLSRSAYERAVGQFAATDNLLDYVRIQPGGMGIPDDAIQLGQPYPRYDYSIYPRVRTLLFDPDEPYRIGVTLVLNGSVDFGDGWMLDGTWTSDLVDTVKDPEPGASVLPHVRTDFRLYADEGPHGIEKLQFSKRGKLSPEVFYEVKAGLLEDMYGGVGGEIVWRPQGSDVSFGANLYWVKQREFDRLFGFRDYSVVTGHVSMYWQDAIWRGVNVNLHAGRYLAGDYGGTVEVTRKFDSGVEIGAFATLTDVPFDEFGEGSFDKGLIIRIPLGWVTPFNTQYKINTRLRSLIRDGGQRLYEEGPLWEDLRDSNETEIRRTWALDVTPGL